MEVKHPIILPCAYHVILLIVRHYHEITQEGRGITTNAIRQAGYWISGIRWFVCSITFSCVSQTAWASQDGPPFTHCAVDCFGPFYNRHKRSDIPRYDVIFTCLVSRAIHLVVADTMDTSSMHWGALSRLEAQYANFDAIEVLIMSGPKTSWLANMKQWIRTRSNSIYMIRIVTTLSSNSTSPLASYMGGIWEKLIRTVRSVLQPIVGEVWFTSWWRRSTHTVLWSYEYCE